MKIWYVVSSGILMQFLAGYMILNENLSSGIISREKIMHINQDHSVTRKTIISQWIRIRKPINVHV